MSWDVWRTDQQSRFFKGSTSYHCFHSSSRDAVVVVNIPQWALQVMFPSACSFIVFWFPLSKFFGLHGHLQVRRIYIYIYNGFFRLCFRLLAALLYVGFHCFSLHVSAYMAIFMCVWFFNIYIHIFKDSASLVFGSLPFFTWSHSAESFKHMKINILHSWRWPCRRKHVVKDSGKPTK
jgi:hypothetical protein